MRHKPLKHATEDQGFTLIELLVVILIIGILAAIAIPSFLSQKNKASDASAKELARTAETVAETIGTDNNGEFAKVSPTEIHEYETTVPIVSSTKGAYLDPTTGAKEIESGRGFEVTATATTGDRFTIKRVANGIVVRSCVVASEGNKGGCPSGSW